MSKIKKTDPVLKKWSIFWSFCEWFQSWQKWLINAPMDPSPVILFDCVSFFSFFIFTSGLPVESTLLFIYTQSLKGSPPTNLSSLNSSIPLTETFFRKTCFNHKLVLFYFLLGSKKYFLIYEWLNALFYTQNIGLA